jgi:hypothetical protein
MKTAKLFFISIVSLFLIMSIASIVSAQSNDCNLWCKIIYLFTGKIATTGAVTNTECNLIHYKPDCQAAGCIWLGGPDEDAYGNAYGDTPCISPYVCGNGIIENGEQCDDGNLNGKTCEDFGLINGVLSCNPDCTFNTANCIVPLCSDGIKNQDETDVDCGGAICGKCAAGKMCIINSDCITNICDSNKICVTGGLPPCVIGDVNGDGVLNIQDIISLEDLFVGNPVSYGTSCTWTSFSSQ